MTRQRPRPPPGTAPVPPSTTCNFPQAERCAVALDLLERTSTRCAPRWAIGCLGSCDGPVTNQDRVKRARGAGYTPVAGCQENNVEANISGYRYWCSGKPLAHAGL